MMTKKRNPHDVCAERWCSWLAFGHESNKVLHAYTLANIEPDGRKLKVLLKAMRAEGFVEAVDPENPARVVITSKAYDALVPVQPDLVSHVPSNLTTTEHSRPSDYDFDKARPGVEWHAASYDDRGGLTAAEKRWVLEHPSDYQLGLWNRVTGEWLDWPHDRKNLPSDWTVLVRDRAYQDRISELRFAARLADLTPRNIAWGLVTAGFAEESDADVFKANDGGGPGFSPFNGVFGKDPARWGEEVAKRAAYLESRIERDRRHAAALRVTLGRVEAAGGWEKFAADYRERLVEAIKQQDAIKEAT